jgi:hypothetical protein
MTKIKFPKLKIRWDQNISIFITCFVISFLLWLMIVLGKDYTTYIYVKATYSNLPEGKMLSYKLPNELRLEVTTSGFVLLTRAIKGTKEMISIDATPPKRNEYSTVDEYQVSLLSQLSQVTEQLGNEYKIKTIFPDNLLFYLTSLSQKIVPVKYHLRYDFLPQFSFADSIHAIPSKVLIKGPKQILDNITQIETDSVSILSIQEDVTRVVPFKMTEDLKQVQIKGTRGVVFIPVDKFTETEMELPISNDQSGSYIIKTFPPKTKVKFLVTLSKFKAIKTTDFKIVAITQGIDLNKANKLSLRLERYPSYIKNPTLSPSEVEFILNQK